ncbi:MAG: glutamine--fructose-6-phosphate transaminase (isomerizing) [Spirochaetia bacterium]|nr:glutamine--fructose-6-phosphate transaminase (isomerizing) [Spirochaetia bacterium]
MCGIVGYIGNKSLDSVLLVGLKKLEYRGYDSAGIAILNNDEISIRKSKGKIISLEEKLDAKGFDGHAGIGHTRWATHGEPSTKNAHPHTNSTGSIAVVHNGIIENYVELKNMLSEKGYVFVSETDTETIPHLIDSEIQSGKDVKQAFYDAIQKLEGKFAIAMICEIEPDRIYFARNGAPLIAAFGKKSASESFLASDLPAIIPLAKEVTYLKDGDWGYIQAGTLEIYQGEKKYENIKIEPILIKEEEVNKGDYAHFMLKEIYEQPDIMQKIIDQRIDSNNRIFFNEMLFQNDYLSKIGRVIIQACGTSLNAGLIGKLYLENFCKLTTDADFSSEFRYRNPVIGGDTLVVGISQSGETADTLAGIHEAKAKFLKVLSFVNNNNSSIARESNAVIDLMAGPEIGVASTKAYTSEVLSLFLFSIYMSAIRWVLPKEEKKQLLDEIKSLPSQIASILKNLEPIQEISNYLKDVSSALFLGRTYNYASALEGALKLKEISYIHASGYAGGEFKHGPIALISEEVPSIVIVPQGEIRKKTISNLLEVRARKGKIISIITKGDDEVKDISDFFVEIPELSEPLSPLLTAIPMQLIAYFTAVYRGCDVDKPRNLAKSVTVE